MSKKWPDDGRTVGDVLGGSREVATLASVDLHNWGVLQVDHTMYSQWKPSEVASAGLTPLGQMFEAFITLPSEKRT